MKKIVVIGPESTGKSTLCDQLASYYQTVWVREYAREFLLKLGRGYGYDDLLTIARGQVALEDSVVNGQEFIEHRSHTPHQRINHEPATSSGPLVFMDTDQYVMKVWSEFVFDRCHTWILDQIVSRSYDLYLLCNTDLPWVKDELREYPDPEKREQLFHIYKDLLINQEVPWAEIRGNGEQRLQTAIAAVNKCKGC